MYMHSLQRSQELQQQLQALEEQVKELRNSDMDVRSQVTIISLFVLFMCVICAFVFQHLLYLV